MNSNVNAFRLSMMLMLCAFSCPYVSGSPLDLKLTIAPSTVQIGEVVHYEFCATNNRSEPYAMPSYVPEPISGLDITIARNDDRRRIWSYYQSYSPKRGLFGTGLRFAAHQQHCIKGSILLNTASALARTYPPLLTRRDPSGPPLYKAFQLATPRGICRG